MFGGQNYMSIFFIQENEVHLLITKKKEKMKRTLWKAPRAVCKISGNLRGNKRPGMKTFNGKQPKNYYQHLGHLEKETK